ncbi:MAG: hypothetical protein IJ702_02485, partial [Fretibacterium sp.]|nr:hypothetical protein [Fretibacterium sp.]
TQADARTNTYPVTAVMPQQKDVNFLPGMAVIVEVNFRPGDAAKPDGKYAVPATAILNGGTDENFVWRYEEGAVRRVPVSVGAPRSDGSLEVAGPDLRDGDIIVTAGVHFLREGQKVRLMEARP